MKYLYNFNVKEFVEFVRQNNIDIWYVYDYDIEDRYEFIFGKDYFNKLNGMAIENDINFDEAEIVSWLDGMSMLYESLGMALKNSDYDLATNLNIIGELHIPFSRCRADSVLIKDNKILIIEFTYKTKRKSRKEKYEEKLNQVICYKELLSNALPKHIEIATYSFPIEVETDKFGNIRTTVSAVTKDKKSRNYDNCYFLGQFIKEFFRHTSKNALEELEQINDSLLFPSK